MSTTWNPGLRRLRNRTGKVNLMLTATVSGSFHRHLSAIQMAVDELLTLGVVVLSPRDPRVVDARGEFLFVASDPIRSVRLVEDRHLECIKASDFVWLVAPDGYVGQSASLELGFAVANDVPIFSSDNPYDLTLRQYVQQVGRIAALVEALRRDEQERLRGGARILINPHDSIPEAQERLESIRSVLTGKSRLPETSQADAVAAEIADLERMLFGSGRRWMNSRD